MVKRWTERASSNWQLSRSLAVRLLLLLLSPFTTCCCFLSRRLKCAVVAGRRASAAAPSRAELNNRPRMRAQISIVIVEILIAQVTARRCAALLAGGQSELTCREHSLAPTELAGDRGRFAGRHRLVSRALLLSAPPRDQVVTSVRKWSPFESERGRLVALSDSLACLWARKRRECSRESDLAKWRLELVR